MKISEASQGSLEWLTARAGVITASEMHNIFTTDFEARTGQMPKSYLARKLAEKWMGGPIAGFQSIDMDFGNILEEEAIPWFTFEHGVPIKRVGLITNDEGTIGCSPDGLIGEDGGAEIKCPRVDTHVAYLLANKVPPEYIVQVHAALYVTGRQWWNFVSYHRRMPNLVLRVERDEEIIEKMDSTLGEFLEKFNAGWDRLVAINGGPPKRHAPIQPKPDKQFVSDDSDIPC